MRHFILFVLTLLSAAPAGAQTRPAEVSPGDAPLKVGFLLLEGVYNSELVAPFDIFHHTVFHTKPGMELVTIGRSQGPVTTFEGLRVMAEYGLDAAPPLDVLVVPSAVNNMGSDLQDLDLISWVQQRGREAKYVVSVCDGAFILAEAGLLDGRRCTTFPGDIDAFRERYRSRGLSVVEGVSFVADGPAITGAGGARSYDPAMYLVQHLYGEDVARGVSKGMVLRWDLDRVRHLVLPDQPTPGTAPRCWLPGDQVDPLVSFEDADGDPVHLFQVLQGRRDLKAVVLAILGGAEGMDGRRRGGFWCEDTFSEIANLRHLHLAWGPRGVLFIGVLCPPVHDEARFGYDEGAFLTRRTDDELYVRSRRTFVERGLALQERDMLPFDLVFFDPRFRLLADPRLEHAAAVTGPTPTWQGRFKWYEDTQTYGTPTIWVLDREGYVHGPPFFMNVYESEGRKLRYRPDDVSALLERIVEP